MTFGVHLGRSGFSDVRGSYVRGSTPNPERPILEVKIFGRSGLRVHFRTFGVRTLGAPFRTFGVGGFRTFGVGGSFMADQGWESR